MIIYSGTKKEYINDCLNGVIEKRIGEGFGEKNLSVPPREIESYKQSSIYMANILIMSEIEDDVEIAIEYQIPSSSKRIDFLIAGLDENNHPNIVIVELKQWTKANKTNLDAQVETVLGGGLRLTAHPSYQAYTYAKMIEDYNEYAAVNNIVISSCAYLHNYDDEFRHELDNEFYIDYIEKSPIFFRTDGQDLIAFLEKHVKKGTDGDLLYELDNGKIKPTKSLQDVLSSLLKGNKEFNLIDEQKTVYEIALDLLEESINTNTKNVLIVEGGPGTGKTVVAINLLVEIINRGYLAQYATKNLAPRKVFVEKLIQGDYTKRYVENLFKGTGSYVSVPANEIDCVIVDETHRVIKKSRYDKNAENQIMEIINASKFAVFFIDEDQIVTFEDIGTIKEIKKQAAKLNAKVYHNEATVLASQFRCNGSDGYLNWLDNLLEIRETANIDFDFDYDFQVFDDPNEMREALRVKNEVNNKSRIVAGYCWEWDSKSRNNPDFHDIVIEEYNFSASWNLSNSSTYAIDEDSFEQIGCIHTTQGLEFDYVGVIIGRDLYYDGYNVQTDRNARAKSDKSLNGLKKYKLYDKADRVIRNTYKTLMSRGQKGCYVFVQDDALREHIKLRISRKKI